MKDKEFTSQALKVNLAETRKANIVIPENHLRLIAISENYWGIRKRTRAFFEELHHPYTNYGFVAEEYRKILLGDRWLYAKQKNSTGLFLQLLNIASELFGKPVEDKECDQLFRTWLEFFGQCDPDDKASAGPLVDYLLEKLDLLLEKRPDTLVRNSDLLKKHLRPLAADPEYAQKLLPVIKRVAAESLKVWRESTPTEEWFNRRKHLFPSDYSSMIGEIGQPFFDSQQQKLEEAGDWDTLCSDVLFFNETASYFKGFIIHFGEHIERFYYILFLLQLPGMEMHRTPLLWELNKILRNIRREVRTEELTDFLDNIFSLFDELRSRYMSTVLDCILTLGKEVIDVEEKHIISYFENKLIALGFVGPGKVFIQDNWQFRVDPNHLKNIRIWLELIMHAPYTFRKLLSALIVNLRLGGIFIFDTDLFQRDISRLLNSNISPIYKQIKQLTRIFPVYFNEIGAEGKLRDATTVMDEISGRQDKLIHFLRKQIHIEGNNTHIDLCRKIFLFWYDGHIAHLKDLLPSEVLSAIDTRSRWFIGVNRLLNEMGRIHHTGPEEMLKADSNTFENWLQTTPHANQDDRERVRLLFKLYALLREKYSFEITDVTALLGGYRFFREREVEELRQALDQKNIDSSLHLIFDFMERLNGVIFDPKFSQGWESIYHKRHIAFGIPSMYGQYREDKFEALGLIFRLERLAATLMEEKIYVNQADYITARYLKASYEILSFFQRGLELDGVSSQALEANLQMLRYGLTSESFTLGQFINLFQFMAKNVKGIINTYFFGFYDQPLRMIIPLIFDPAGNLDEDEKKELIIRHSESFYREILYASFLIQPLDNYIGRMINVMQAMVDNFPPEVINDIMSYDADLVISPLYSETPRVDSQIFLGSKAYFQKKLLLEGLPVPPGFVLSTEVFRHRKAIASNLSLQQEVYEMVHRQLMDLEKISGKKFGDPKNPLLLSVRSGTAISMPGAMNTFLNVGMNDRIVKELSMQPGFGWTSWDCYRRLLQSWGMTRGISRDAFDQVMIDFKNRYRVERKVDFGADQMREMAFAYKKILSSENLHFEEDLWEQLKQSMDSVIDSWGSERAKVYRNHLQIDDEWGTAVVIQQMVLGNIDDYSGTGVVFTHNPLVEKPGIYLHGDFTLCSQGEDIVAGLVHALPVSEVQKSMTGRENQESLQEMLPDIYHRLREIANELVEEKGYNHQEIEFTFESPDPEDLYILQIRDQETHKKERLQLFEGDLQYKKLLGRGIGGGGGALNGRMAIDMEDIIRLRKDFPGEPAILLRPDTVPDDIPLIFECDGLVTARGGATSHAAVTAARLGKVCVLNCRSLSVDEKKKICWFNGLSLRPGDKISVDGFSGNIFKGHYKTEYTEIIR